MSDYGSPGAAQQRQPDERLDGIQKLSGTVTFNSGSTSVDVTIPVNGGSLGGTSEIEFGGSSGATVGSNVVFLPATVNNASNNLTATGLAAAAGSLTTQYTVKMTYMINGKQGTALTGSVAAPLTGAKPIVLQ